jgi:hypothetical protein
MVAESRDEDLAVATLRSAALELPCEVVKTQPVQMGTKGPSVEPVESLV